MGLDPVFLSRLQFGFVISFRIIIPAFTIGLAAWLATIEGRAWSPATHSGQQTGRNRSREAMRGFAHTRIPTMWASLTSAGHNRECCEYANRVSKPPDSGRSAFAAAN